MFIAVSQKPIVIELSFFQPKHTTYHDFALTLFCKKKILCTAFEKTLLKSERNEETVYPL